MKIQVLHSADMLGRRFKVYGTPHEPMFLAKDVAKWIEHSNPTEMIRSVDEDEKLNSTILSAGQNREVTMLTENGLYEVLMQSRKPIAKQFKKHVKAILREIRQTGRFESPAEQEKLAMQKQRAEAMLLNARTRQAKMLMELKKDKELSPIAMELLQINTVEILLGEKIEKRPLINGKHYSATEIGEKVGLSKNMVGKIANALGIKNEEHGIHVLDKAAHSEKQVEGFKYNEKGLERIKEYVEKEMTIQN